MFDTPEGKDLVLEEHVPPDHTPATTSMSDEEIDKRVRHGGTTVFHPGGTAGMGRVVDGSLKVKGVKNLRVADASVIPQPLAAHYQVIVYAIAEQADDILLSEEFGSQSPGDERE